jgi:hypothetical protein
LEALNWINEAGGGVAGWHGGGGGFKVKNLWFSKCLTFRFVVFVVAGCIVYVSAVVVSFIVVFL